MKSVFIIAFFVLFSVASSPSAYAQSRTDRKVAKHLQTDIAYLASDELGGRLTGSEGEKKAAAYIQQRYKAEGIGPYKGQYIYPFKFVYGKAVSAATQIKIGNNTMRLYEEAFPLPFSTSKRVYSEILPDVMEAGNIWMEPLYNDKGEADDPHFDWEKTMYARSKEAITQGASGVLFYDNFGSPYEPEFDGRSYYETINLPVAFLRYDAYEKYIYNGNSYEAYIRKEKSGLPVELNIAIDKPERTGNNIAAYIDNKAAYTVIIGAHYDHLGHGELGNTLYTGKDKPVFNGADDNASGTAALLQVADWIKKHKLHHYNYLFINFSGEELGLLGSKAFIKNNKLDSTHVAYMINMDMIGRLNDSTHALYVGGVGTSPVWSAVIEKAGKQFKIVIDSSGVGPSDHTSFYHQGIPVLFFFTGLHKDYHKPTDKADKINYVGEATIIRYADNVIAEMDKTPKPGFTATRQSSVGQVSFKVTLGIMPDYSYQDGGVRVDGVSEGRPAIKAGIKEGDIIIRLGSYEVQGMQTYMEALSRFSKGEKTNVTIRRNGKELTLPVVFDK